jgi:hypothetical protein
MWACSRGVALVSKSTALLIADFASGMRANICKARALNAFASAKSGSSLIADSIASSAPKFAPSGKSTALIYLPTAASLSVLRDCPNRSSSLFISFRYEIMNLILLLILMGWYQPARSVSLRPIMCGKPLLRI